MIIYGSNVSFIDSEKPPEASWRNLNTDSGFFNDFYAFYENFESFLEPCY